MTPTNRAARAAVPFALAPAVAAGIILAFTAGWIWGVVAFVVIAVALGSWARFGGEVLVVSRLGGREADAKQDARLCNLVEGLSTGAGVRQPRLRIVESPGLNAMAAGIGPSKAVVAVTTSLLDELDRMELEAVLAEELCLIRRGETAPGTVVAATFGLGRSAALLADADARADQGAVSLTRYPPALASALEKIEAKGSVVDGQGAYVAHLWLADPRQTPSPTRGRLALRERIEALREL